MKPQQRQQLTAALLSAFDADALRQLCRFALDLDIDQISTGDLTQRVSSVVDYVERQGLTANLAAGALRQNPGNEQLQALVSAALTAAYIEKKTSV